MGLCFNFPNLQNFRYHHSLNMMSFSLAALSALSTAGLAAAHMNMISPPPLRHKSNPNSDSSTIDYSYTAPLNASGANFPCKGYLRDAGTPEGKAVDSWTPGRRQKIIITGGANHNGGSCQASFSFDNGKTWKVVHSWIGNCPVAGTSDLDFTIPSDTPAGDAIFAWSWFNQIGNREMYMNCAVVNIKGAGKKKRGSTVSIQSRPDMFVANVGNGCGTTEGTDVMFPDPGPDVSMNSQKTGPPTGQNCGKFGSSHPSAASSGENKPATTSSSPAAPEPTPTKSNGVNNGQIPPTSTPVANAIQSLPVSTPSQVPDTLTGGNGTCTRGAYTCTSDATAWQVCGVAGSWIVSLSLQQKQSKMCV
jgi:hypothetical protein